MWEHSVYTFSIIELTPICKKNACDVIEYLYPVKNCNFRSLVQGVLGLPLLQRKKQLAKNLAEIRIINVSRSVLDRRPSHFRVTMDINYRKNYSKLSDSTLTSWRKTTSRKQEAILENGEIWNSRISEDTMTAQLCLVVLFYTLSPSLAGFFQLEHPQQAFCEADFGKFSCTDNFYFDTSVFKLSPNEQNRLGEIVISSDTSDNR